jgi:hypothetical protein
MPRSVVRIPVSPFLDFRRVSAAVRRARRPLIRLAGPRAEVDLVRAMLRASGVPARRLKLEYDPAPAGGAWR